MSATFPPRSYQQTLAVDDDGDSQGSLGKDEAFDSYDYDNATTVATSPRPVRVKKEAQPDRNPGLLPPITGQKRRPHVKDTVAAAERWRQPLNHVNDRVVEMDGDDEAEDGGGDNVPYFRSQVHMPMSNEEVAQLEVVPVDNYELTEREQKKLAKNGVIKVKHQNKRYAVKLVSWQETRAQTELETMVEALVLSSYEHASPALMTPEWIGALGAFAPDVRAAFRKHVIWPRLEGSASRNKWHASDVIVSEWAHKGTLNDTIARAVAQDLNICDQMTQICMTLTLGHAVLTLHSVNLLHCDIKPENVFMTPPHVETVTYSTRDVASRGWSFSGEMLPYTAPPHQGKAYPDMRNDMYEKVGMPKLGDFDLVLKGKGSDDAKVRKELHWYGVPYTALGPTLAVDKYRGTFGYVAPEVAMATVLGRPALYSERADVFSLGMTMMATMDRRLSGLLTNTRTSATMDAYARWGAYARNCWRYLPRRSSNMQEQMFARRWQEESVRLQVEALPPHKPETWTRLRKDIMAKFPDDDDDMVTTVYLELIADMVQLDPSQRPSMQMALTRLLDLIEANITLFDDHGVMFERVFATPLQERRYRSRIEYLADIARQHIE